MISQGMITALSVGGAILAGRLLTAWAGSRTSTGKMDAQGWTVLKPAAFVYPLALVFPAAFVMLIIALVTDQEPQDAAQSLISAILFVALGGAAAYSLWLVFGRRIRWKEDSIRLSRWFLPERHWRMADAQEVTYSYRGFLVRFGDGSQLRFKSYENGASELADLLRSKALQAQATSTESHRPL